MLTSVCLCRCGRCRLQNVKVLNKGIDWSCGENAYWKHSVQRFEALKVILHGNAEFEANNVILEVRMAKQTFTLQRLIIWLLQIVKSHRLPESLHAWNWDVLPDLLHIKFI